MDLRQTKNITVNAQQHSTPAYIRITSRSPDLVQIVLATGLTQTVDHCL